MTVLITKCMTHKALKMIKSTASVGDEKIAEGTLKKKVSNLCHIVQNI